VVDRIVEPREVPPFHALSPTAIAVSELERRIETLLLFVHKLATQNAALTDRVAELEAKQ
jgi:hypothetical protein